MTRSRFHPSCVTDLNQPVFGAEWQRRACGLAVALSEFGHDPWEAFQQELIAEIGAWEEAPADSRGRWEYAERRVAALHKVVQRNGLLDPGYVDPEDRRSVT